MDITLIIFVSLIMFSLGIIGVLTRRNAFILFLSIELMLNSANLLFVVFARYWGNQTGLVWVFFVLLVAAAEAAVGLAIMIHLFRAKRVVDIDQYNLLKE